MIFSVGTNGKLNRISFHIINEKHTNFIAAVAAAGVHKVNNAINACYAALRTSLLARCKRLICVINSNE